jgi:hypothetical protein
MEDFDDLVEFLQELFDEENVNLLSKKLMSDALLHYVYFPQVVGSILNTNSPPLVSISTALYIILQTQRQFKYNPLINSISIALMHQSIP